MIADHRLDFWIKNNLNVLFTGHAGVGKTTIVKNAIERNKLKWVYFSAATLDPWIDLCGCPREMKDEDGKSFLDLVRPLWCKNDDIDIIFFDELNRSTSKVRNSVLELIQFKSINGKKFNNLKMVWAAINPDEENEVADNVKYDVERLDPAIKDRFHIQIDIPYKPYMSYFKGKFDINGVAACEWWHDLPSEMKQIISPRRLDYALEVFAMNGDIRDVLPEKSNVSKLITLLNVGPIKKKLEQFVKEKNVAEAEKFINVENQYTSSISYILGNMEMLRFFIPLFNKERISQLLAGEKKVFQVCCESFGNDKKILEICREIQNANLNEKLIRRIKSSPMGRNIILEDKKNMPVTLKLTGDVTNDLYTILKKIKKLGTAAKIAIENTVILEESQFKRDFDSMDFDGTYHRREKMKFLLENQTINPSKIIIKDVFSSINQCAVMTQVSYLSNNGDGSPWVDIATKVLPHYLFYAVNVQKMNFSEIGQLLITGSKGNSEKKMRILFPLLAASVEKMFAPDGSTSLMTMTSLDKYNSFSKMILEKDKVLTTVAPKGWQKILDDDDGEEYKDDE